MTRRNVPLHEPTHDLHFLPFIADGYGVEDLLYEWTHGPARSIKMASDMRLSQFDLVDFPAGNETYVQHRGTEYAT